MDAQNSFSFNWGSQQSHILDGLKSLFIGEISSSFLTDVTLACDGEYLEAHRLVLSLCSSFFKELFNKNERVSDKVHGIVIMSHVSAKDLRYILQFMYQGSVQVSQKDVDSFLESGKMLKVEGLVGATRVGVGIPNPTPRISVPPLSKPCPRSAKTKKRRHSSASKHSRDSSDDEATTDKKKPSHGATNPKLNIKLELNESAVPSSFQDVDDHHNDDGGGIMLDDCGDGGDSDIGEGGVGELRDELETAKTSTAATMAICEAKSEQIKTLPVKRRPGRPRRDGSSPVYIKSQNDTDSTSSSEGDDSSEYDSSSTVDYLDAPPSHKKRRGPRIQHTWILIKSFSTLEEARADLQAKKQYSMRRKQPLSNGIKHFYDCREGKDCLVKACLFERNDMDTYTVEMYKNDREHNHEGCEKQGLTAQTKDRIHQLWAKGVRKPKSVMQALKKEGMEPKLSQLASYIQYNIRSKINSQSVNKM